MRLDEFANLSENTSKEASIKIISDILIVQLSDLYRKLTSMAEAYYRDHGTIDRGFRFIAGGQKANWFQNVYFTNLKPALYNLKNNLPNNIGHQLGKFLSDTVGTTSLTAVEDELSNILENIGKSTGSKPLIDAANNIRNLKSAFKNKIDQLDSATDDSDDTPHHPKQQNVVGQQNVTVDAIISDALSRINPKQAGEIRNVIAKSDNKLKALQSEFKKRGIKL